MFDPVYFEDPLSTIEDASEAILPDSEFGERTAGQRFEEVVRRPSRRIHDIVEFRNDTVLDA
ncbi:hypothetical protein A6E15_09860 [Natrinema saccharevitans]|uniref:Uncharacterized protein n=1 Tax=Natrinema saccharevitans TaxID=301967 RepID=A0A1S8AWP4_9EURY|nr:hypothetical protein [Natrinema saccharevitans]OLZ41273.1 hypothetical protein A6E15_09860 [Natrinema saccharevitans]